MLQQTPAVRAYRGRPRGRFARASSVGRNDNQVTSMKRFLHKVRSELETPRHERPFGSGWLSGWIGLLAGVVGLLIIAVIRNPSLTSVPQLAALYQGVPFKIALYFVLTSGF